MLRIQNNASGPGQDITIRVMHLAGALYGQGNRLTVSWVPRHRGVIGNNMVFPKESAAERAMERWQAEISRRNEGRGVFQPPGARARPSIRTLWKVVGETLR